MISKRTVLEVVNHICALIFLAGIAASLSNIYGTTAFSAKVLRTLLLLGGVTVYLDTVDRTEPMLEGQPRASQIGMFVLNAGMFLILLSAASTSRFWVLLKTGVAVLVLGFLMIVVFDVLPETKAGGPEGSSSPAEYPVPDDPLEMLDDDEQEDRNER